jgi:antitoxin PrlF
MNTYSPDMEVVVSERGQVTIPKKLRLRLGIRQGDVLDFEEDHGVLVGRKVAPADPLDTLYGIIQVPGGTDAFVAEMRDEVP